ncbi:TPA: hypothetical protein ACQVJW_002992, partial [Serratia marcescens]
LLGFFLSYAASSAYANRVYRCYSCDYFSNPLNVKGTVIFIVVIRYHIVSAGAAPFSACRAAQIKSSKRQTARSNPRFAQTFILAQRAIGCHR